MIESPQRMITDINSEDRLVQQTFAEHLRDGARLGERLRLERRDLRAATARSAERHERDVVLTRDLRAALAAAQPRPAANRRASEAHREADAHRLHPLAGPAQPRVLPASSATACRSSGATRAAQTRHAHARVIDFRNARHATASSPCAS